MDKFPEKKNLQKLNHEKIENLNRSTTGKGIELVIKNTPTNKSPEPDGFIGEFNQTFKLEFKPILLKLFQKIEEESILPNILQS